MNGIHREARVVPGSFTRRAIRAAAEIEAEGREVTYVDLAGRIRCSVVQAKGAVNTARAAADFPFRIKAAPSGFANGSAARKSLGRGRDDYDVMDMAVLEQIRAEKFEAERRAVAAGEVDVRVYKYYSPHARHYT